VGDAWISGAVSGVGRGAFVKTGTLAASWLNVRSRSISATGPSNGTVALTLAGPNGHVVSAVSGIGTVRCSLKDTPAGIYLVRVTTTAGVVVSRLAID
jgi:hypothetical protein